MFNFIRKSVNYAVCHINHVIGGKRTALFGYVIKISGRGNKGIAHQIINQGNGCFNKYPKDLRDKIKNELAKIDYKTKENYEGFRVLLNKIKEIIDEDNIQNLVKIN